MKPENVTPNPESKAKLQFTPETIEALAIKGWRVTHLVMTHNLEPKPGEPSVVITYTLLANDGIKLHCSREQVLSLAHNEPALLSGLETLPDEQIISGEEDGLETDLPTGGF